MSQGGVTRLAGVAFMLPLQARQSLSLESRGCKVVCKRSLFFDHDYASYLTYLGSPLSSKQPLSRVLIELNTAVKSDKEF